jgi:hypothetical protein
MEIPLPISLASLALSAVMGTSTAATGTAEWHFGPDVSENYACQKAEMYAKIDAVRNALGENIFVDEFSQCTEHRGDLKCNANTALYSTSDAYIKSAKVTRKEVYTVYGKKSCSVDVDVRVTNERPNIDAFVDGRFFYKSGENINFMLKTNKPTKVWAFHIEGNRATLVWPSFIGTNNAVANELAIPTPGYKMVARAGKFDESVVFVFTNEDPKFMRDYNVEDLNNKLMSLKISDRRIVRRNLIIEQ